MDRFPQRLHFKSSNEPFHGDLERMGCDALCKACERVNIDALFQGRRILGKNDPPSGDQDLRCYVNHVGAILENEGCPLCELLKFAIFEANPQLPRRNEHLICASGRCPPLALDWSLVGCYLVPFASDYVEKWEYIKAETRQKTATALWIRLFYESQPKLFEHFVPNRGFKESDCVEMNACFLKLSFDETNEEIIRDRPLLNGVIISENRPNFNLFKEWISACKKNHVEKCAENKARFSPEALDAFRLVDVRNRMVVSANPEVDEYAALSYVWGASLEDYTNLWSKMDNKGNDLACAQSLKVGTQIYASLPPQVPKTIEDALAVCEKISLRYLWVDLFCIDQQDAEDKRVQIHSMGHIYSNAAVTILAAAGNSCSYGLAGLGGYAHSERPAHSLQVMKKVQGRNILTTLPSTTSRLVTQSGSWAKRGWTYQEALLSKRCLIFGEDDVVFICRNGFCRDSFNPCTNGGDEFPKDIEFPPNQSTVNYSIICTFIHEQTWFSMIDYIYTVFHFAERYFTKEDDVLDALGGYLAVVEKTTQTKFVFGLPKHEILDALCWMIPVPAGLSLLPNFPSWTWAGWRLAENIEDTSKEENAAGRRKIIYPLYTQNRKDVKGEIFRVVKPRLRDLDCQLLNVKMALGPKPEIWVPENSVLQCAAKISFGTNGVLELESEVALFRVGIRDPDSDFPFPRICLVTNDGQKIPPYCSGLDMPAFSRPADPTYTSWAWAFNRPVEFLMLKHWEEFEKLKPYTSFRFVVALPLDDRAGLRQVRRTCALFLLPINVWEEATPTRKTVYLA